MDDRSGVAVLVVTTLPESGVGRARVLATPDIERAPERGVVVQSLAELQDVMAAWWSQAWGD